MTLLLVRTFIKDYENTKDARVRTAYGKLAGTVGIVFNVLLFFTKLLAGTLAGSVSITADALNNLTDASSGIISLLGFKMAAKPADPEHPYGHARYEYLAGLSVAVIVLLIGVDLLESAVHKILNPTDVRFSLLTGAILSASILIKIWLALFNRKMGKTILSQTLLATAADSRNDAIATGAVLLSTFVSHFFFINLDGYMGAAVALFILYSGIGLVRETISPLLGRAPDPDVVRSIEETILAYPGVLGTHDLIVHDYGPGRTFASVHVEMAAEDDVLVSHDIIDNIERDFLKSGLHLIVHYDPIATSDTATNALREWLSEKVRTLRPGLSIHDLRTVQGPSHTNVIFDLVIPQGYKSEEKEIKSEIRALVDSEYPHHFCVITVDYDFAGAQHQADSHD